ncbi:glucokinase [Pseudodonghicola xiamenensis]|uniref:Glucokinase n=1 Tax=Pseudodonghicola xiamenensis TaxID=337702 RepID=A0A8J3MD65_9RHOB|nr:ROK family protein [Pseudodonghicola xiamenensis]GHG93585.1 glucokinase [Pseudodonghicola xiamenensis]
MTDSDVALLADIGGTKTRIALGRAGVVDQVQTCRNSDFPGPEALIGAYLRMIAARPRRALIAVAGPVETGAEAAGRARLTNLDWELEPDRLRRSCGFECTGLVNDLEALAMALPDLAPDRLMTLRAGSGVGNGQALVANFGTGFNVGLLRRTPSGPVAFAAELGHGALPAPLAGAVAEGRGEGIATLEDLFAGAGLSRLHRNRGQGALSPEAICAAAAAGEAAACGTLDRMAHLIGLLLRELVFAYLPQGGLYLAGGMVRAVLTRTQARAAMLAGFAVPTLAEAMPLCLIMDDSATLTGLARLAAAPSFDQ